MFCAGKHTVLGLPGDTIQPRLWIAALAVLDDLFGCRIRSPQLQLSSVGWLDDRDFSPFRYGALHRLVPHGTSAFLTNTLPVIPGQLLTVKVDRLTQWYRPGLLCIGDAAHAMSPVGGVGINLAIQDAVAAANSLAAPLREGRLAIEDLRRVQHRRMLPTRLTQRMQLFVQDRIIRRVLSSTDTPVLPYAVKLLARFPFLRRIPARLIGMGIRPEHVRA